MFRETLAVCVIVGCTGVGGNTLWFWDLLSFKHFLGDWRLPAHKAWRNYRRGHKPGGTMERRLTL